MGLTELNDDVPDAPDERRGARVCNRCGKDLHPTAILATCRTCRKGKRKRELAPPLIADKDPAVAVAASAPDSVIAQAWRRGIIAEQKCDANQLSLYAAFKNSDAAITVFDCARQMGKSFLLCIIALEQALVHPGSEIKYACPTAKMARKIVRPLFRYILRDCPADLMPVFNATEGEYQFRNGSSITIAGCDKDNADNLRGQHADLWIVDEAGFVEQLSDVVKSILLPQTINTAGRGIIASTPPKTPGHAFTTFCNSAKANGAYHHRTIYDNPRATPAVIESLKRESGGEDSSDWKREYLCLHVIDSESAVVPQATPEKLARIVVERRRPRFFDSYTAMRAGFPPDQFGILFGYIDYNAEQPEQSVLVIEDECITRGGALNVKAAVPEREKTLWGEEKKVFLRPTDGTEEFCGEVLLQKGPVFCPTMTTRAGAPDNAIGQDVDFDRVGTLVQSELIAIHPRCRRLRKQLETAVWEKHGRIKWTEEEGLSPLLRALAIMAEGVRWARNPVPANVDLHPSTHHIPIPESKFSKSGNSLRKAFGLGQPRRGYDE